MLGGKESSHCLSNLLIKPSLLWWLCQLLLFLGASVPGSWRRAQVALPASLSHSLVFASFLTCVSSCLGTAVHSATFSSGCYWMPRQTLLICRSTPSVRPKHPFR